MDFRPIPSGRSKLEHVKVGGRDFAYSDDSASPGFHVTNARGDPIHAGEYVRITSYKGDILKLEIRE